MSIVSERLLSRLPSFGSCAGPRWFAALAMTWNLRAGLMQQVEDIKRYAERISKDAENGQLFGLIGFEKRADGTVHLIERGNFSFEDPLAIFLLLQTAISELLDVPIGSIPR
jgi:hypothetical protein